MATYGDGICDVPMDKLIAFHNARGGMATLTSVPLQSQYGTVEFDEHDRVSGFREKPRLTSHWINAGFFVMNKAIFDHWEGNNLEREVFPQLVKKRQLYTYRHDGFFKSMDTYKDQQELEELMSNGDVVPPMNHRPTDAYRYYGFQELQAMSA